MYSLFIDTHDKLVSVILFKDGIILNKFEDSSLNKHSVITLPAIRDILEKSNILVNDLNEIIVVNGPGSFTGERIAVTIGKTMAYSLNIPIKVIDSLTILALNIEGEDKYVALPDKNGAFVGHFNVNNVPVDPFVYVSKNEYEELMIKNNIVSDIEIDYSKVYEYVTGISPLNPHEVKPLYVKGISVLNDKKA